MNSTRIIYLILLLFVIITAKPRYITDSFDVPLRKSAYNTSKIVEMVKSGEPITILDGKDEWIKIKVNSSNNTGWVKKQYVMTRVPYKNQYEYLLTYKDSIVNYKSKISDLKKENKEINKKLIQSEKDLAKKQKEYADLLEGSANYVELKTKYDSLSNDIRRLTTEIDSLTTSNKNLSKNLKLKWAIIGFVFFLISYLLGKSSRKKQRRLY